MTSHIGKHVGPVSVKKAKSSEFNRSLQFLFVQASKEAPVSVLRCISDSENFSERL